MLLLSWPRAISEFAWCPDGRTETLGDRPTCPLHAYSVPTQMSWDILKTLLLLFHGMQVGPTGSGQDFIGRRADIKYQLLLFSLQQRRIIILAPTASYLRHTDHID